MMIKKLFLIMVMAMISFPIFAESNKTIVFTVSPKMVCGNCENKIKSNLRFEKGVKSIETSLSDQTVTVSYNPEKNTEEKLIEAFKKIGYTASVCNPQKCDGKSSDDSCCGSQSACTSGDKKCCGGNETKECVRNAEECQSKSNK